MSLTKLPRLYVVMLRYRVAAMVALFLLLGAAREGELDLGWRHLVAALALASSYVSATALNDLTHVASRLTGGLFLLFAARIVLKDFRDRAGDAEFGKPRLLLRFGKTATCASSLAGLGLADVVFALALDPVLALLLQPFVLAIAAMLWRLWRADGQTAEQVAIGTGARMGNGLLLTMLAWLVVKDTGASLVEASLLSWAVAAALFLSFVSLAARPDEVLVGYKG